jgi:hypothetical protein
MNRFDPAAAPLVSTCQAEGGTSCALAPVARPIRGAKPSPHRRHRPDTSHRFTRAIIHSPAKRVADASQ